MKDKRILVRTLRFLGVKESRQSGFYYTRVLGTRVKNKYYKYPYKVKSFYWIINMIESVENLHQFAICSRLIELYKEKTKDGASHLTHILQERIQQFSDTTLKPS